jgi:phospholipid N-methyltransferase
MMLEGSLDCRDGKFGSDHSCQPPTSSAQEAGAGRVLFLKAFMRNPRGVAAVLPSSRRMGRMMAEELTYREGQTIVEIGPGTGSFTSEIVRRLEPDSRVLAIEREPIFADHLRRRLPARPEIHVCEGDAIDLHEHMDRRGMDQADYVVSGIGWPSIARERREAMLGAVADALVTGGKFLTFGYHVGWTLPSTWSFWRFLQETFRRVSISPVIWANVPPAYIYRCVK